MNKIKEGSWVIKKNGNYAFRDYQDNINIPEPMMEDLKKEMNHEEAILCFMNSLIEIKNKEEKIKEVIELLKEKENKISNEEMFNIVGQAIRTLEGVIRND